MGNRETMKSWMVLFNPLVISQKWHKEDMEKQAVTLPLNGIKWMSCQFYNNLFSKGMWYLNLQKVDTDKQME